jgi:centrosomal protein CEP104
MDLHFWKDCPLLTECPHCNQVIEIETYNTHLLQECDKHSLFKQCPRCKESIHADDYEQHVEEKACLISKPPKAANRCGLCHQDITPAGEEGWKQHLLVDKCPFNPRKPK